MAITAPGGGEIFSGDKVIERKVIVTTDGTNPQNPGGKGILTSANITQEAGGIKRGVFEYTLGLGDGGGGATYDAYGRRVELLGGTREVPIYNHPYFATLTRDQIETVQRAVENKAAFGITDEKMSKLYSFLIRKIEYALVPSLVARITEIESGIPPTDPLGKVSSISEPAAPDGTFWVMTGLNAVRIGNSYEVSREYTSIAAEWADADVLYNTYE